MKRNATDNRMNQHKGNIQKSLVSNCLRICVVRFHCRWLRTSFVLPIISFTLSRSADRRNKVMARCARDSQVTSPDTNLRETPRAESRQKGDNFESALNPSSDSFSAVTTRVHSRNQSLISPPYVISPRGQHWSQVMDFVHRFKDKIIPLSSVSSQTLTVTHSASVSVRRTQRIQRFSFQLKTQSRRQNIEIGTFVCVSKEQRKSQNANSQIENTETVTFKFILQWTENIVLFYFLNHWAQNKRNRSYLTPLKWNVLRTHILLNCVVT